MEVIEMLSDAEASATIAVADVSRAKSFYRDTLGLSIGEERPTGLRFECGGGTFLIVYPSPSAGTARSTVASFQVDDLDATMADLRRRGVKFENYDSPGLKTKDGLAALGPNRVRVCWFKDPDGNILSIVARTLAS
ncbi:MAG: VOC family protein [Candidatus Dormibacteraeota bacterium]|nr:VOC family protein [Candidatus Dormibacteraeota bacterium]MDQ6884181.1 VOC family protein [Candidatus Dormibacteraeota bacterium]